MLKLAPELQTICWLNSDHTLSLKDFRGRVVLIEAFQMLCPGCVSHGLPQARRVYENFHASDIAVIGLHTVFEHHDVQGTRQALEAFLHENQLPFPVAIDAPSDHRSIPKTMGAYNMRGTPTLTLIDREGHLRKQKLGLEQDLVLGAEIMSLIQEPPRSRQDKDTCTDESCPRPASS